MKKQTKKKEAQPIFSKKKLKQVVDDLSCVIDLWDDTSIEVNSTGIYVYINEKIEGGSLIELSSNEAERLGYALLYYASKVRK